MLEELIVLRRDNRLDHRWRNLVQRNGVPILNEDLAELLALPIINY